MKIKNKKTVSSSTPRLLITGIAMLGVLLCLNMTPPVRAYTNNRLMDDLVFDNQYSMNEGQIQSFLDGNAFNGRKLPGPSTCLRSYMTDDFNWNGSSYSYGAGAGVPITAAQLIAKVSREWGLNPQVIIATLQKEESLVTGAACDGWRYNSAMGYGCPDSGGCNAKYAGLTKQVLWGSWQLKFGKERSLGNTGWNGDSGLTYVGYMTRGTFKRCGSCAAAFYDGYATIDGQSVYLETGTTASMYSYTPHLGQSFPGIFEGWFGSTYSNISPVAVPHPDGTLVDIGGTVYLIEGGAKRNAVSASVFLSNGFNFSKVKRADQGDLQIADGPPLQFREGTLLNANGGIYAVDVLPNGSLQKRGFASWNAFASLGYRIEEVMSVSSAQLPASDGALITDASVHPDGTLVQSSGGVFLIEGSTRRGVLSAPIFSSYGYSFDHVKTATGGDLALASSSLVTAYREGFLFLANNGILITDTLNDGSSQKRAFASWDIFVNMGFSLSEVAKQGPSTLPDGPPIGP